MRRTILLALVVIAAALLFVAAAAAGNGGFAPPTPQSPNTEGINAAYKWIALFTGAIFLLVEGALVWFVVRYRRRGRARTAEGPQIHGATRLELIWTALPVLVLAAIAAFIFYKLPGIEDVPAAKAEGGPLVIDVDAHQFYWQFTYPNGAVSIDELRAPVHRTVKVEIRSSDVVHSWWVPELSGKFDAIPGRKNETWFKADRVGTYRGQCGEFCGAFHAAMTARVRVTPEAEYRRWTDQGAARQLGASEWRGVCAKCHGLRGRGGYGPAIANNQLLIQEDGLRRLLLEGQNRVAPVQTYMPPVGRGWNDRQFDALFAYLKSTIYKGQQGGS